MNLQWTIDRNFYTNTLLNIKSHKLLFWLNIYAINLLLLFYYYYYIYLFSIFITIAVS